MIYKKKRTIIAITVAIVLLSAVSASAFLPLRIDISSQNEKLSISLGEVNVLANTDARTSGTSIIEDTPAAYLEATPHTLNVSGWVELTYYTKLYDGAIDIVCGFSGSDLTQIKNAQVWESYVHTKYRQVEAISQETFPTSTSLYDPYPRPILISAKEFKGKLPAATDIGDISLNSRAASIVCLRFNARFEVMEEVTWTIAYETFDGKVFTYNYRGTKQEVYYETYEDWNTSIPRNESKVLDYGGVAKWESVNLSISTTKNISRKARVWIDIPFNGGNRVNGKYCIGIKPSELSLTDAKAQGKLWIIDPWYSSAWTYRKSVTLSRASGAVSNYPVKLLLGESSGATGEEVDCNSHCQTDFDDIRFTNSGGVTLLDYWIESITGTTPNQLATIWIEFDSIGTGATTFYMYYGNASAIAVSNGTNTFIFFDGFANLDNWNITNAAVSGGICTITSSGAISSKATYPADRRFRARVKTAVIGDGQDLAIIVNGPNQAGTSSDTGTANYYSYDQKAGVGDWADLGVAKNTTDYLIHGILRNSTTSVIHLINDSIKHTTPSTSTFTGNGAVWIQTWGAGGSYLVDWVFVSQYLYVEPAWGSWGSEETFATDISNTPSSKAFGVVAASTTYYAKGSAPNNPVVDGDCTFTITNNDTVNAVKVNIKATNFTGGVGWALTSGAPGSNTVRITAYPSGTDPASGVVLTTSDQVMLASLAAGATKKWDFKFEAGTFTDGEGKTSTITLTGVIP